MTTDMFNEKEKAILLNIKQNGGTAEDAKEALDNFRTGKKRSEPRFSTYISEVGVAAQEGLSKIGESVTRGAEIIEETQPGSIPRAVGAVRAGAGAGAGAIETVLAPVTPIVKAFVDTVAPIVSSAIDKASNNSFIQKIATNPIVSKTLDTVLGGIDKVKAWANANPDAAQALIDTAEVVTTPIGVGGVKLGASEAGTLLSRGARALTDSVPEIPDLRVPSVFGSSKTAAELEQKALKASAELLQSGSKKSAMGRAAEFNNADIQAMRLIRDSLTPLPSQQELATFFDKAISVYSKNRDDILRPILQNPVDDSFLKDIKDLALSTQRAGDVPTASQYAKIAKQEKDLFNKVAKSSAGGNATVEYLATRIKEIDRRVEKLYNDVGVKDSLLPEQKIEVQGLDEIRKGLKRTLDTLGGEDYANLGKIQSGLIDARNFARIQRDKAKNALSKIEWEVMTPKERALFIKDLLPTLKDFGVSALVKLDTKADVLDSIVEQKVRQIRQFGNQAIEQTSKK